jgi:hypothetical protein
MMKTKQKTLQNKYFSKTLLVDSPYFQDCATPTPTTPLAGPRACQSVDFESIKFLLVFL